MNKSVETLVATAKANLEAAQALASKAQNNVEKLVDLNMSASKAALSDSLEHSKALMGAKDPQSLASLQAGLAKPLADKSAAYAQDFQKIVAGASAEFTKAAQANLADVQKNFATLVGTFLGILLAYAFAEPLAGVLEQKVEETGKELQCIRTTLLASMQGYNPSTAIEFGRKVLYSTERPSFVELESYVKGKK